MRLQYYTLDVFTDKRLAGNPLAVVRDADGLDSRRMQMIAREFNLSETVFLVSPRDPVNTARARIFTPAQELPFAGPPTIGAAVLIGELDAPELMVSGHDLQIVLEEQIGPVTCSVRHPKGRAKRAQFKIPRLPEKLGEVDASAMAAAVGLSMEDIGFDRHYPVIFSAGVGVTFIPILGLEAMGRAHVDMSLWDKAMGSLSQIAYLYTREVTDEASHVHARMFAPSLGITEDPATGGAAAAFAGVAMEFEKPEDGEHVLVIEQGIEMGRPSKIVLIMEVSGGALTGASIGGEAVIVTRGEIEV